MFPLAECIRGLEHLTLDLTTAAPFGRMMECVGDCFEEGRGGREGGRELGGALVSYRLKGMANLPVGAHEDKMGKMKAARKGRVSMHCVLSACGGMRAGGGLLESLIDDDLNLALVLAAVVRESWNHVLDKVKRSRPAWTWCMCGGVL